MKESTSTFWFLLILANIHLAAILPTVFSVVGFILYALLAAYTAYKIYEEEND